MNANAAGFLQPDQTALLVVDFQHKLVPKIHDHRQVLHNSVLLLRLARILELPIVLTTQYRKGLGDTVPEILAEIPDVPSLDKTSFGCFGDTVFCDRVADLGRRQLLVCGIESHICVTQTVLGALQAHHEVHVASDAVGSRTAANARLGLERMQRAGAVLSSAEMAIYELLRRSDVEAFKHMLPHLKG